MAIGLTTGLVASATAGTMRAPTSAELGELLKGKISNECVLKFKKLVPKLYAQMTKPEPDLTLLLPAECLSGKSAQNTTGNDGPKSTQKNAPKRHGVWASVSPTFLRKTDRDGDFDGTVLTGTFGIDRWVLPKLLLGASVGLEKTELEIGYNNGSVDSFGRTVSLYGGYMIAPWLIADANYGYSWIDYNFIANSNVTSATDARRWTGAANLTAHYVSGPFGLKASVGIHAFDELKDDATDSTTRFVPGSFLAQHQANAGLGADYRFLVDNANVTLNADAKFGYDFVHPSGAPTGTFGSTAISTVDPSSVVFGFGITIATRDDDATLSVKGTTTQFQENTESFSIIIGTRLAF